MRLAELVDMLSFAPSRHSLTLLAALGALLVGACGGSVDHDPGASGGPGTGGRQGADGGSRNPGGTPFTGGAQTSGGAQTYGGKSSSGGEQTCCLAEAICQPDEKEIPSLKDCPAGYACHETTICCSTIYCARPTVQCTAVPVCDAGDAEITGECPPDLSCYTRSLCGSTIRCRHSDFGAGGSSGSAGGTGVGGSVGGSAGAGGSAGSCSPTEEYNRNYVSLSPAECTLIFYGCAPPTKMFSNACGCGCEQSASCPEWVNCEPGSTPRDALCTVAPDDPCPYTVRAQ